MKIIVQHQAAIEGENPQAEQTCVWIVGDDGETLDEGTSYLKAGQEVELDAEVEVVGQPDGEQLNRVKIKLGDVGPLQNATITEREAKVDPDIDQKADERPVEESDGVSGRAATDY